MQPLLDKLYEHRDKLDALKNEHDQPILWNVFVDLLVDTHFMIGYVQKHMELQPEWEAFIIRMHDLKK